MNAVIADAQHPGWVSPLVSRLGQPDLLRRLRAVALAFLSGLIGVVGVQAIVGVGLGGAAVQILSLGSLVLSIAALWLVDRSPTVAATLAAAPFFLVWLSNDGWLVWWFVAQVAVLGLAALRAWQSALAPVLGMLVSAWLILSSGGGVIEQPGPFDNSFEVLGVVWAPGQVYVGNDAEWLGIHLAYLACALLFPAAAGVLVRARFAERVVTARESAVRRSAGVQAERARLAHDLHDVVAHHVSLIAVRAETAPYTDPDLNDSSQEVLSEIADEARRALEELRGVLGVLHRAEEDPALGPQPSLRDLPDLVDRAGRAGDRITAEGVDAGWVVPETVGYVVYRVAQEALTNARRHARGARVDVRLHRDDDDLVICVHNEAGAKAPMGADEGQGLTAMADRVGALGGVLVAGPQADGGFALTARVPVTGRHK